jgi:aspartate kinase
MSFPLVVSKFGGTSMGDFSSMKRSAVISVERHSSIVVVSATSGTTDKLIQVAKLSGEGRVEECEKLIQDIKNRHLLILAEAGNRAETVQILQGLFTELDLLAQNISLLRELTPKAYDHMLSLGERMSSVIFRDVLQSQVPKKEVLLLDARTIIKTDSHFGKATPQIEEIEKACKDHLVLRPEIIYVTQGFIGSDADNNTTILGRGGSDYSAALFAEGISATCLEIWTDVAGVATTDPRICPQAKIIPELSYSEAGEMAQYGAKILHPATIAPAVRKSIPVFVGSSFDKDLPGTWIRQDVAHRPTVRAITKRGSQALLTITQPSMLNASGFMSKIFDTFARHRISVDCVTTAEYSVAITVDNTTIENERFLRDLENIGSIEIETGLSLISLIGNEMHLRPNQAKPIFSTIEGINIRMMSLGASPYNFNFLVNENQSHECITRLHKTLIETPHL